MFAGVGERTREGNDLYREMIESVRTAGKIAAAETTHSFISIHRVCGHACIHTPAVWWAHEPKPAPAPAPVCI